MEREGPDAVAGTVNIPAGSDSATIESTSVANNSQVFVTVRSDQLDAPGAYVYEQRAGSFTLQLNDTRGYDLQVNWWVVN